MSDKKLFVWVFAICMTLALQVSAQTNNDIYNFVTIDDGIPKSAITKIIQDK